MSSNCNSAPYVLCVSVLKYVEIIYSHSDLTTVSVSVIFLCIFICDIKNKYACKVFILGPFKLQPSLDNENSNFVWLFACCLFFNIVVFFAPKYHMSAKIGAIAQAGLHLCLRTLILLVLHCLQMSYIGTLCIN